MPDDAADPLAEAEAPPLVPTAVVFDVDAALEDAPAEAEDRAALELVLVPLARDAEDREVPVALVLAWAAVVEPGLVDEAADEREPAAAAEALIDVPPSGVPEQPTGRQVVAATGTANTAARSRFLRVFTGTPQGWSPRAYLVLI